jgi:hypothetical protein
MTAQSAEAARALAQRGGDPADEHAAVPPAAHVADEMADLPIEVLDRVRAPQRPVERAGDAEALEGERLVQSSVERRGGTGVGGLERGGELEEAALGERGIGEPVRLVEHARDPRAHRRREMRQNVPPLVDLAPLDDGRRAARLPDRLAEAGRAVDHEEDCLVEIEPALAEVGEERLADGRVLGRALAEREDVRLALEIHAQHEHDDVVAEVEPVNDEDSNLQVVQGAGERRGELRTRQRDEAARHAALRDRPLAAPVRERVERAAVLARRDPDRDRLRGAGVERIAARSVPEAREVELLPVDTAGAQARHEDTAAAEGDLADGLAVAVCPPRGLGTFFGPRSRSRSRSIIARSTCSPVARQRPKHAVRVSVRTSSSGSGT